MLVKLNVTFVDINKSLDHNLSEQNIHKWGSPNCATITQSIASNHMISTEQYFEIKIK